MKIYSKIIIDMATDCVLKSESFDYKGPIALCCSSGGGAPEYPEPSAEEIELLQLQLDWLKQMGADMEKMRPFLLQSMGLKEGTEGNLLKMTQDEYYDSLNEMEQGQYDLTIQAQERMAKAYAGELDVSPALEKQLGQSGEELDAAMSEKLGPDWETTTAGMQAKSQFDESASLIREEVRSGVISSGTGSQIANLQAMSGITGQQQGAYSGFPGQGAGIFAGAGQMAGHYAQERANKYSGQMAAYGYNQQKQAGLMAGFGSLAGSGLMAAAMLSSKALKKNIEVIDNPIEKIMAIRGVEFDWKSIFFNTNHGLKGHDIGVVAEELEKVMPEAIPTVDGYKAVEYYKIIPLLIEGIKSLQYEVNKLKEKK